MFESIIKWNSHFSRSAIGTAISSKKIETASAAQQKLHRICLIGKLFPMYFSSRILKVWIYFVLLSPLSKVYLFIRSVVFHERILCRSKVVLSRNPVQKDNSRRGLFQTSSDVCKFLFLLRNITKQFISAFRHSVQIWRCPTLAFYIDISTKPTFVGGFAWTFQIFQRKRKSFQKCNHKQNRLHND